MSLSVNFKLSGVGNSLSLDLEPCLTILAVKALLKEYARAEPEHMKLIFKGRILKDTDTLESSKFETGQSMHVVKSAGATSTANLSPAGPAAAAADAPTGPQADALAGMAMAGAGAGGANPMAAMMQDPAMMQAAMQMMGGTGTPVPGTGGADPMAAMMGGMGGNPMGGMDPAMMSQMMQNPMVQQMMQNVMQNPAMLQQMIQSNPMLQQMTQNNPMMAQMISNPQFMQSAMQMVSNPQMMQAMGGMQAPALEAGGAQQPVVPPVGGAGGMNPMAAMMQDPSMMQAMMGMMGGAGGTGEAGMPGAAPGGANPFEAMMGGAAPTPARCACGNFESGRGDGLCNSCRNSQSPP